MAADQGAIVPYILYWRAVASGIDGYAEHVAAPRFDPIGALRFSMLMVEGYNAKSRAAKKEVQQLKALYEKERADAQAYRRLLAHPLVRSARRAQRFFRRDDRVTTFLKRVRWARGAWFVLFFAFEAAWLFH